MKILETTYVFDASAQTVELSNYVNSLIKERVYLIVNVEDGIIIYNFSDPAKGATLTQDAGGDFLTLEYDTTSMSDSDPLLIIIDDETRPASDSDIADVYSILAAISMQLPSSLGPKTTVDSFSVTLPSDMDALALESGGNLDAIKTAVQLIDNFISGARGLVTEDNSAAILSGLGATADAIVAAGAAGSLSAKLRRVTQGLEDLKSLIVLGAGTNNIGDVDIASIAAGDNNIGNVDVVTLPSIPAGTNNIGDVDVLTVPADPFGANADAAVAAGATGSMQAKFRRMTQGLEDLKSLIVLAAGTNAIGKLAANSGVDIGDVDVTSLPATPAGTNLIGKIAAQHSTSAMSNGTTDVTPKFAKIDRATNADGAAVVSLVSAKKIRVLTLTVVSAGTVSVKWQSSTSNSSGAGSNTDLSGFMSLVANTGMADVFSPVGLFETVAGEALKLNLNAAVQVSGYLTYLEI